MACKKLDKTSANELLKSTDSFLFDCDGVLWDGKGAISGSLETVNKLLAKGKRVLYVSNNSTNTREEYVKKCQKFGYKPEPNDIACSAHASAFYLNSINFSGKVYVVGNPAMGVELDTFKIKHTGIGPDPTENSDPYHVLKTKLDDEVACVLVGYDPFLNIPKISKAASYLQKAGVLFLVTNEDSHSAVGDSNIVVPGTGTMVSAVKCPARREPTVVGKPEKSMFEVLRETHKLDPSRCCFVGDNIYSDIRLAKNCNLKSLLVLSGVCTLSELGTIQHSDLPDLYTSSLKDLGNFIDN